MMARANKRVKKRAGSKANPWPFSRPDARRTTSASGGIAYHTAKRRPAPAKKAAAAVAGKKGGTFSLPDERTIQEGFKRGLSLREILAQNPALQALWKLNPSKFDRCVKAVKAKGGAANAYAVCTAAGTRNPSLPKDARSMKRPLTGAQKQKLKSSLFRAGRIIEAGRKALSEGRKTTPRGYDQAHWRRDWIDELLERDAELRRNPAAAVCTAAGTRNPDKQSESRRKRLPLGTGDDPVQPWEVENVIRLKYSKVSGYTNRPDGSVILHYDNGQERRVSYKDLQWLVLHERRKRNPAAASAEVFKEFHGFEPFEVITVTKKVHHHAHLASLGILVYLEVWGIDKVGHTLSGFKKALIACNEDRNQLFIEGGDQGIDLKAFGIRQAHELETLGKVLTVGYSTDKKHLGSEGGKAVYVHDFTTTNENGKHVKVPEARLPQLIYDVRNEQLLFSGGSYEILREGIDK